MDRHKVLLFDGVCNLCAGSVQFILKRDKKGKIHFASLQSKYGQDTLKKFHLPQDEFDSLILLDGDKIYRKSTAALKVARELSGLWSLLYVFMIIPPFLRNGIYSWLAKNRYRFFGKKESCMLPTPEIKERFVE